jgi:hypothetical protein
LNRQSTSTLQGTHVDAHEERKRIAAKIRPVAEVKSTKPAEESEDGEVVWPADLRRQDDDDES